MDVSTVAPAFPGSSTVIVAYPLYRNQFPKSLAGNVLCYRSFSVIFLGNASTIRNGSPV